MKIISEERCFKGAGYNKIHETLSIMTLNKAFKDDYF